MYRHNTNVKLLDRNAFEQLFTEDRDLPIDGLQVNHRSDFVRAYLLKHFGGLYVDADCVVLRSLAPVFDLAAQHGFVGYREPDGYMSCNFMASQPSAAVINAHYALVCSTLRTGKHLEWLDLASVPMDHAVDEHPNHYTLLPTQQVMPLSWSRPEQLVVRRADAEHERFCQQDAFCYMLSNNTLKQRDESRVLIYLPASHLLRERYFLSFLFRKAFDEAPLNEPLVEVLPHLGGHENLTKFDEGAFDYLVTHFNIRSMVDIGAGQGGMVYYALSKDLRAVGVDGDPSLTRDNPAVIEHDYARAPLYLGEFDLGWSVEFVEHVEEQFVPNFMASFKGCRRVFITAAVPGQPGHHHVNCQPGDYWISRFDEAGFDLDTEATEEVRKRSTMFNDYTRHTGLVFTRRF